MWTYYVDYLNTHVETQTIDYPNLFENSVLLDGLQCSINRKAINETQQMRKLHTRISFKLLNRSSPSSE